MAQFLGNYDEPGTNKGLEEFYFVKMTQTRSETVRKIPSRVGAVKNVYAIFRE